LTRTSFRPLITSRGSPLKTCLPGSSAFLTRIVRSAIFLIFAVRV
jgi:hypothetical protein